MTAIPITTKLPTYISDDHDLSRGAGAVEGGGVTEVAPGGVGEEEEGASVGSTWEVPASVPKQYTYES